MDVCYIIMLDMFSVPDTDLVFLMSIGNIFHRQAPAYAKLLSSKVVNFVLGNCNNRLFWNVRFPLLFSYNLKSAVGYSGLRT